MAGRVKVAPFAVKVAELRVFATVSEKMAREAASMESMVGEALGKKRVLGSSYGILTEEREDLRSYRLLACSSLKGASKGMQGIEVSTG